MVIRSLQPEEKLFTYVMGLLLFISAPLLADETLKKRCQEALDAASKHWQAGKADEAHAVLDPLIKEVRAKGDRASLLSILNLKGQMWASLGYARDAEKVLREAVEIGEALEDSKKLCKSLRWLYVACDTLGRKDEANALCQRLLKISRVQGDREHEAWALAGIASNHQKDNDAAKARQYYEESIGIFQALGKERSELWVRNGLGMALQQLKAYGEARRCYTRCAELAAKIGFLSAEANALNSLGCMEYTFGDASKAEERFRRAYDLYCADGNLAMAIHPANNIALCFRDLGRFDEARVILEELLSSCREQGYAGIEIMVLIRLAQVWGTEGKLHKAATIFRQVLARNPSPDREADARVGLSSILTMLGETEEALHVLEKEAPRLRPRLHPETRHRFDYTLNKQIVAAGRTEEALENLLEIYRKAEKLGKAGYQMDILVWVAQCYHDLDRMDQSLELLQKATAYWEKERGLSADPSRREHVGIWGQQLFVRLTDLLMHYPEEAPESRRINEAFNTLQRFKSRTLQERMRGPAAFDPEGPAVPVRPPITLKELQERILRPGELLIETVVGPKRMLLMAITRDHCRGVKLPGLGGPLGTKLLLYHELLSDPGAASDIVGTAGRALSRELLEEIADLVQGARRIILVPDSWLNLIPLSGLYLPGGEGLLEGRELMRVPSATILAEIRSRPVEKKGGTRILALSGEEDNEGKPLAGAAWEVEHLCRSYEGVERCAAKDLSSPHRLTEYDILHLAGHVTMDDQHPWRSGLFLGKEKEGGKERALRASEIVALDLDARLAVLSGCASARGKVLPGEGVLGMTSAFLSAGAPVVLASLWPVDDSVTARFMDEFYGCLGKGKTVASALSLAQHRLMEDPRTEHPFYWAGFILAGDGDRAVPLDRKGLDRFFGSLAILCLLVVLVPFLRRRRE